MRGTGDAIPMGPDVKALIVGLGSMGTRRIRALNKLGIRRIAGHDIREERSVAAVEQYGIEAFHSFDSAVDDFSPDFVIISTSPAHHMHYAFAALEQRLPSFIEASVVEAERIAELSRRSRAADILMAPSCTMMFFEGPRAIRSLLRQDKIGAPLLFSYHVGQWLEDWHPWEDIRDFYVSERETGGCRELVPFELTWLNKVFGPPRPLTALRGKRSMLPADIDDFYQFTLQYPGGIIGNITVEVLSRPNAVREMRIVGERGSLEYNEQLGGVRYSSVEMSTWENFALTTGTAHDHYINPEEPYIEEMAAFISAVQSKDPALFPNDLESDYAVLRTLGTIEEIADRQ